MLSKISVAIVTPSFKFKYKKYWIFFSNLLRPKVLKPKSLLTVMYFCINHFLIFFLCFPSFPFRITSPSLRSHDVESAVWQTHWTSTIFTVQSNQPERSAKPIVCVCLVCGMLFYVVFISPLLSFAASCIQEGKKKKDGDSKSAGQVASAFFTYALTLNSMLDSCLPNVLVVK